MLTSIPLETMRSGQATIQHDNGELTYRDQLFVPSQWQLNIDSEQKNFLKADAQSDLCVF